MERTRQALAGGGRAREALLLDRDGVINVDRTYVARKDDFVWRDGIFDLVAIANRRAIPVVVITNQSGIGLNYYTEADFQALTAWMCATFAERGTPITRVYHCPYHPEAKDPALRAAHPWRKPAPGMILAAADDLCLDLGASVMVGDQWSDAMAAERAGVGHIVLVGEPRQPKPATLPKVERVPDVTAVARWYAARQTQLAE
ncbi:MAG: HAD family hydrolase [Hyphomicrobiaceae bacterium]|nr:HAD family hydrolase [Hyphomicrobiaceae bacterium]